MVLELVERLSAKVSRGHEEILWPHGPLHNMRLHFAVLFHGPQDLASMVLLAKGGSKTCTSTSSMMPSPRE